MLSFKKYLKNIIVILFKTGNNLKKKFTKTLIIDFKIMSCSIKKIPSILYK